MNITDMNTMFSSRIILSVLLKFHGYEYDTPPISMNIYGYRTTVAYKVITGERKDSKEKGRQS